MAKRRDLVFQHLEGISRAALEEYQDIIRDYVRGKPGIYALYRRGKLYYVGLASNLRSRLRTHLSDKHAKSWDRFSVYLTVSDHHMKELESLILRVVKPVGNKMIGKFAKSENLRNRFRQDIREHQRRQEHDLFGLGPGKGTVRTARGRKPKKGVQKPDLAGVFPRAITLWGEYKGKEHKARLRRDGTIHFQGKVFESPSRAAAVACRRPRNGWNFWYYKSQRGDWVRLGELRR